MYARTRWKHGANEPIREVFGSFAQKRGAGKISLRRSQWRLAEKNASMAIWLGKQYLGQRDVVELGLPTDNAQEDALSVSLREMAEGLESDD